MSTNAMLQEQNQPEQYQQDFSSMEYIGADRYNLSEFERTNLATTWTAAWQDIQGQVPTSFISNISKPIIVPISGMVVVLTVVLLMSFFNTSQSTTMAAIVLAIGVVGFIGWYGLNHWMLSDKSLYEQRGKVDYAEQQLKRLRQQFIARSGIFQHLDDKSSYKIMMQQLSDIYYHDLKNKPER